MFVATMMVFDEDDATIVVIFRSEHDLTLQGNENAAKAWAGKAGLKDPNQITTGYHREEE